jgi:hypothetical protein
VKDEWLRASEVAKLLRRSAQNLNGTGLNDLMTSKWNNDGLIMYDAKDVERWRKALIRRDGLMAFRHYSARTPLKDSIKLDGRYDTKCPRCNGLAINDPEGIDKVHHKAALGNQEALLELANGPVGQVIWCPVDGMVKI